MADEEPKQQIRVPVPQIPLPLNFLFGIVNLGEQPVILCTAGNDAGSMVQGFISPENATQIARGLLSAARNAELQTPKKLQVVSNGGLVVPAGGR